MTKVTDEMLMAYADGELEQAAEDDVRRATESDVSLARRAEAFRTTRRMAREAFAAIKAEPVPERLIAAALGGANANITPARARHYWARAAALPLAASIALIAGLAGYWIAQQSAPGGTDVFGGRAVAEALGETASGAERTIRTAAGELRLRTLGGYRVEGGLCRLYELSGGTIDGAVRGIGCHRGSGWHVDVAVATSGSDGAFTPASGGTLDAFLDALDAQGPLSTEEEAALAKNAR